MLNQKTGVLCLKRLRVLQNIKREKISLSKLEQTKENLDRLQDILDELERQIGPLEKQAKKQKSIFL